METVHRIECPSLTQIQGRNCAALNAQISISSLSIPACVTAHERHTAR